MWLRRCGRLGSLGHLLPLNSVGVEQRNQADVLGLQRGQQVPVFHRWFRCLVRLPDPAPGILEQQQELPLAQR